MTQLSPTWFLLFSLTVELSVGGVVMARRPQILGWILVNESSIAKGQSVACSLMTSPFQLGRACTKSTWY